MIRILDTRHLPLGCAFSPTVRFGGVGLVRLRFEPVYSLLLVLVVRPWLNYAFPGPLDALCGLWTSVLAWLMPSCGFAFSTHQST